MKIKDKSPTRSALYNTTHGQRKRPLSFWSGIVVFSLAVVVIVACLSAFYLVARAFGGSRHEEYLLSFGCSSSDCFKVDGLLGASLNASVNPCDDFKAYVTSRWLADPSCQVTQEWRYQWDVKYRWMRMLADEMRSRRYSTTQLGAMVAKSFTACENRSTEKADETRRMFKQLLRNLGAPWPEVPLRDDDPFEVHLKLCVRWNMPLWFDVTLLPGRTLAGRQAVYVGPSVYAKFWRSQYTSMNSDSVVSQYINQYLAYFTSQSDTKHAEQIADYKKVFNFTKHVVFKLAEVHRNKGSETFSFKTLADALGQKADHFVSLMNRYFRPEHAFVPDDVAIVQKKGTSEVARYITESHDPKLILSHLGWWVVQIYAPIADARFFIQKYGSNELADLLRPLFCETQMESSFKILLLSKHFALKFSERVRQNIDDLLRNVREEAATMYEESNLAPMTRTRRAQKIRLMRIDLWPKVEYGSSDQLRQFYLSRYSTRKTALDHWIGERQANADLIGTEAYYEDKRLPHSFSKDSVYYDTYLNTVSMSMIVAHDPFYFADGEAAINYGGLGAAFSKTIVEGVETDTDTKNVGIVELNAANNSLQMEGDETASQGSPISVARFLPAFRAFLSQKRSPPVSPQFSPERLFFISYCHTQTRIQPAFDCNKELRGVPNFVFAFQCEKGSHMNP
ncbi:neprilysin-2-like [Amblyomma americanum]